MKSCLDSQTLTLECGFGDWKCRKSHSAATDFDSSTLDMATWLFPALGSYFIRSWILVSGALPTAASGTLILGQM